MMLRNPGRQDILYFATSPFLLLFDGQASDRPLLYSEDANGYSLSLCDLNVLIEYLLPSLLGNRFSSEIQRIFVLWAAEQGHRESSETVSYRKLIYSTTEGRHPQVF